jgi:hypothetical protein
VSKKQQARQQIKLHSHRTLTSQLSPVHVGAVSPSMPYM